MVEVFKTNITDEQTAERILGIIQSVLPNARINFDLSDSDNILRMEAQEIPVSEIMRLLAELGYQSEILP